MSAQARSRNSSTVIAIDVKVFDVGQQGNSPSGRFLFIFSRDVVHVSEPDTEIQYILTPDTLERGIRFIGYFASDSHAQLTPVPGTMPSAGDPTDSICLVHANDTESLLVHISLQVTDLSGEVRGSCDPQITNVPSPRLTASQAGQRRAPR